MILLDDYIAFLITNELTPQQYLFLHLIKDNRLDLLKKYKESFPNKEGTMIPKLEIKDLIDKGFILKENKSLILSNKIKDIFVTSDKAVDEIYDIYPSFLTNELNVSIPLSSMDREVFKNLYIPKIMGSVKEHIEVIKDIKYAIEHNLIKVGINKFVTSEQWKAFRKLRKQDTKPINTIKDEESFS